MLAQKAGPPIAYLCLYFPLCILLSGPPPVAPISAVMVGGSSPGNSRESPGIYLTVFYGGGIMNIWTVSILLHYDWRVSLVVRCWVLLLASGYILQI